MTFVDNRSVVLDGDKENFILSPKLITYTYEMIVKKIEDSYPKINMLWIYENL